MSAPAIGALRVRLQLETPVDTPDGGGGFARSWRIAAELWGKIEPLRAADAFAAQRGEMAITHRIVLRWRPDVTGAMRLRSGARVFRILTAVDADPLRRFLVCQCLEIAP